MQLPFLAELPLKNGVPPPRMTGAIVSRISSASLARNVLPRDRGATDDPDVPVSRLQPVVDEFAEVARAELDAGSLDP